MKHALETISGLVGVVIAPCYGVPLRDYHKIKALCEQHKVEEFIIANFVRLYPNRKILDKSFVFSLKFVVCVDFYQIFFNFSRYGYAKTIANLTEPR